MPRRTATTETQPAVEEAENAARAADSHLEDAEDTLSHVGKAEGYVVRGAAQGVHEISMSTHIGVMQTIEHAGAEITRSCEPTTAPPPRSNLEFLHLTHKKLSSVRDRAAEALAAATAASARLAALDA